MTNEYYGAATTPTEDFLAHYGVRGMKWGVRKSLMKGNEKRLARNFAKAEKKLAKLQKRAESGKKYAKRAAALGAGAALAGGVAATGTRGISNVIRGASNIGSKAALGVGQLADKASGVMTRHGIRGAGKVKAIGKGAQSLGLRGATKLGALSVGVNKFGASRSIGGRAADAFEAGVNKAGYGRVNKVLNKVTGKDTGAVSNKLRNISNSGYTRIAGAAAAAGLGAGAAYNAYRAATTKRAAKKAAAFKAEMNKAFAGTKYANGRPAATPRKKRRG